MTDIEFFKKEVASHLSSFNLEYRSYADGDLGVLEQVVFICIGWKGDKQ